MYDALEPRTGLVKKVFEEDGYGCSELIGKREGDFKK